MVLLHQCADRLSSESTGFPSCQRDIHRLPQDQGDISISLPLVQKESILPGTGNAQSEPPRAGYRKQFELVAGLFAKTQLVAGRQQVAGILPPKKAVKLGMPHRRPRFEVQIVPPTSLLELCAEAGSQRAE